MRTIAVIILLALASVGLAIDTVDKPIAPDGTKAIIDLPATQHMRNVGGSDGAGLCVYTAVTMAARWGNERSMYDLRKFAEGRPGGSYPEKLASDITLYCKRKGVAEPAYVQHTGGDETFLDLVVKTRRMASITYAGMDGFYDAPIAHMVNLSALDIKQGAIIDNNRPGSWVWMKREQLLARWKGYYDDGRQMLVPVSDGHRIFWQHVGGGWAFVWLAPPAPPVPPKVNESAEPVVIQPTYVWERHLLGWFEDQPHWFCYKDGTLIFVIEPDGTWHTLDAALVPDPPVDVPSPPEAEPTEDYNKGVRFDRLRPGFRYWIGGVECSRAKAYAAVADPGGLVDDSDRYHLSIINDSASQVKTWFAGPLAKYARRVHIQVYTADDWPAKDRLHAAVTLQEPGKIGGKIVGTASVATQDAVAKILADVFDPPAPAPAPPAPAPRPNIDPPARPTLRWPHAIALAAGLLIFRRKS